jgi:hypothetical protein
MEKSHVTGDVVGDEMGFIPCPKKCRILSTPVLDV